MSVTFGAWQVTQTWTLSVRLLPCIDNCAQQGLCTPTGCQCFRGFKGADCRQRACAVGTAPFDVASAQDVAHALAECSNNGFCDTSTGQCRCREGWTGWACDILECPGPKNMCNGHGTCTTMSEAAAAKDDVRLFHATTYGLWDQHNYGCVCFDGWSGYDCSVRPCLTGDDPLTTGQVDEIQLIKCVCTNCNEGNFWLTFRGQRTGNLPYTTTMEQVEAALELLPGITDVTLAWTSGSLTQWAQVCYTDARTVQITFTHDSGDLPSLAAADDSSDIAVTVYATGGADGAVTGTKENVECNNRGFCVQELPEFEGTCECVDNGLVMYNSSGGNGAAGSKGDCGVLKSGVTLTHCPLSRYVVLGPGSGSAFDAARRACVAVCACVCACVWGGAGGGGARGGKGLAAGRWTGEWQLAWFARRAEGNPTRATPALPSAVCLPPLLYRHSRMHRACIAFVCCTGIIVPAFAVLGKQSVSRRIACSLDRLLPAPSLDHAPQPPPVEAVLTVGRRDTLHARC